MPHSHFSNSIKTILIVRFQFSILYSFSDYYMVHFSSWSRSLHAPIRARYDLEQFSFLRKANEVQLLENWNEQARWREWRKMLRCRFLFLLSVRTELHVCVCRCYRMLLKSQLDTNDFYCSSQFSEWSDRDALRTNEWLIYHLFTLLKIMTKHERDRMLSHLSFRCCSSQCLYFLRFQVLLQCFTCLHFILFSPSPST